MPRYNLIAATDAWMTRKQFSLPRSLYHLYPSEASVTYIDKDGIQRTEGKCHRESWMRITKTGTPEPHDAYTQWIFASGKGVEEILVEQWKQMGVWHANNVKFYNKERNVSGELDVVIKDPKTGELIIIEVKSFAGYNNKKLIMGNKSVKGRPKTPQLLQLLIYIDLCKGLGLVDYGKLVYYARDTGDRREFNVELTDKGQPVIDGKIDHRFTMDTIYDRFDLLNSYVQKGEMPPRDYEMIWSPEKVERENQLGNIAKTNYEKWKRNHSKYPIGDYQCKWCSLRHECYKES